MIRQIEMWRPVVDETHKSLFSEQMVCSMSTQLFYIPETENLKGNAEMHEHLVPASYHRVTANGSAVRLFNGETHPAIVKVYMNCIKNAEQKDRQVRAGLQVMRDAAPTSYKPFVENIIRWQDHAEMYLQNAKRAAMQITAASAGH